jgi:hypothetical protein
MLEIVDDDSFRSARRLRKRIRTAEFVSFWIHESTAIYQFERVFRGTLIFALLSVLPLEETCHAELEFDPSRL